MVVAGSSRAYLARTGLDVHQLLARAFPAPLTSVTLLSQPVITALFAVPMLGESLGIEQIAGGLIVLAGIFIVNKR